MIKENAKLREIIKSRFRRQIIPFLFSFLLLIITILTGCENVQFNQSFREQLDEDLSVTYKFYETFDFTGNYTERTFYTGNTIYSSDFPVYTHEDELLVGWQYLGNQIPSNVKLNEREYISYVRVALKSESFFGVWKTKRYVTFVTNNDLVVNTAVVAEGYCVEAPQIEKKHGRFRFGGWYIDEELTELYDFSTPVMEDITLYAKWIEFNTIKYHKNFGSDDVITEEYDLDERIWIREYQFELRSAYGFVGWARTPDGQAETYPGYIIENLESDLELYAVWTTDLITVTYIDLSNKFTSITSKFGKGAHIRVGQVINENQRWYEYLDGKWQVEGKEIKGYSTNATEDIAYLPIGPYGDHSEPQYDYNDNPVLDEYGNQQYIWTQYTKITEDTSFYVYWGDKTYWLYFRYINEDGDVIYFDNQEVVWNHTAQRPETVPYLSGHIFVDWYEAIWEESTQTYKYSDTPFDFSIVFNEDNIRDRWGVELFAKFEEADTGEAAVNVEFEESPDSDISVAYDYSGSNRIFTAPAGYLSYKWYLDGVELTSLANQNEITIDSSSLTIGWHDVSLIVYDGTNYYSWSGQFNR